MTILLKK